MFNGLPAYFNYLKPELDLLANLIKSYCNPDSRFEEVKEWVPINGR